MPPLLAWFLRGYRLERPRDHQEEQAVLSAGDRVLLRTESVGRQLHVQ
jgi:hypothetical protein